MNVECLELSFLIPGKCTTHKYEGKEMASRPVLPQMAATGPVWLQGMRRALPTSWRAVRGEYIPIWRHGTNKFKKVKYQRNLKTLIPSWNEKYFAYIRPKKKLLKLPVPVFHFFKMATSKLKILHVAHAALWMDSRWSTGPMRKKSTYFKHYFKNPNFLLNY